MWSNRPQKNSNNNSFGLMQGTDYPRLSIDPSLGVNPGGGFLFPASLILRGAQLKVSEANQQKDRWNEHGEH